jgi:predicted ATPase
MEIERIKATNFKSFKSIDIKLGQLNTLIGANASGKSNFIQLFEFLRDIEDFSLENSISKQGGVEYFRNMDLGNVETTSFEVTSKLESGFVFKIKRGLYIGINITSAVYGFTLKYHKKGYGYKVVEDNLVLQCSFEKLVKKRTKYETAEELGPGKITLRNVNGRIKRTIETPMGLELEEDQVFGPVIFREKIASTSVMLEQLVFLLPIPIHVTFEDIAVYDFDPKLPKRSVPFTEKSSLNKDGSNIAIILQRIIKNKTGYRKLFNLVGDILPFIHDIGVEKLVDNSYMFKLREHEGVNKYLPASFISDGTINVIALIIALFFEGNSLTIIEEPERNIHPQLISKLVEMINDAAKRMQIILTTHNPEFVKHTELESMILISRDEKGFSNISHPGNVETVKTFLKNDIGIEELFVNNLLGT